MLQRRLEDAAQVDLLQQLAEDSVVQAVASGSRHRMPFSTKDR